ncbi:MAG TPA: serine hydrolase, partial [Erythrobacter sp.]|nr:serine hydrolase [Erythrobacter sp.]
MRTTLAALALLALTACEAQPEGEPVARARIDGQPQDAAGDTPTPAATLAS